MKMNTFETMLMTFDHGRHAYLRGIVRTLRELSQLGAGKKILEIGCGNGVGTLLIGEFFKPSEFIATEPDQKLVEIARVKNRHTKAVVEPGDAADLRFQSNEFDAVIGLSVIHHIPNWQVCVDELFRVIKPGGLLILKELSIETFESLFGMLARHLVSHPYDSMPGKDEFIAYLEQKGFNVEVCRPHSMPFLLKDFFLVARKQQSVKPRDSKTFTGD